MISFRNPQSEIRTRWGLLRLDRLCQTPPVIPPRIGINAHLLSTSPDYRAAGTSRYLRSLLGELRRMDPPEEVWAYLSAAHISEDLLPSGRFVLRPTRWPTWRPSARILWEQSVWPLALRRDRIAVAHGAAHALPVAWSGPSVVTVHDLAFILEPGTFSLRNRAYLAWMVPLAVRRATYVIAVSEATRRDVVRLLGAPADKVVRIHEGVDARYRPYDADTIQAFRLAHGFSGPFILFLGTIEPRKNVERLVDAYLELRRRGCTQWPLVLAGSVRPGSERIRQRVVAAGLDDVVHFVGFVPEKEMPLWYNSAGLFVFPSLYEGFGLPALEALACGTPVVASNRSSIPEVVEEAGVLVDPTDVTSIADGMQRVLEASGLRQRLRAVGPGQAQKFTWHSAATQTLDVYRAALDQP